ncbi:carboxymuconolactone decarboxylase family protein [Rhodovulum sp. DZ06]|uniref:carboxymuconolactone decarboxylase family protein n=1 Tax=Rhodovulum sp. DZ06 TaxID=3425126 RepID=UPI003D3425BF
MKMRLAASALALMTSSAAAQDAGRIVPDAVATVSPALSAHLGQYLAEGRWGDEALSPRDRGLITFAALMTRHEADALAAHAELALDAGVTPAELSEAIAHLAFYTGVGNGFAAAEAVAPVFEARGIAPADLPPAQAELLDYNEEAEAARQDFVSSTYGDVSQGVVDDTQKLLFLDLWRRPGLAPRDRSMITVAGLIAGGQPEQMTFHLNRAMDNGLTKAEAGAMLSHLAYYAGWPKVFSAMPVAKKTFGDRAE